MAVRRGYFLAAGRTEHQHRLTGLILDSRSCAGECNETLVTAGTCGDVEKMAGRGMGKDRVVVCAAKQT